MELPGPVEAVFLDVGGVLHLPDHAIVAAALRRIGVEVDPARLDRAHYAGAAALRVWPQGDVAVRLWAAYEEAYAREAGVPPASLADAVTALDAAFNGPAIWGRPAPGSSEGLRALAATGVALAIVSNSDGTLEHRLRAEGTCQVGPGAGVPVAVVVDSEVVGVAKPDPAIFALALAATGVAPERALHVGDIVGADVAGALAAGVRPVHLDPYGLCADETHPHVPDLPTLAVWLTS